MAEPAAGLAFLFQARLCGPFWREALVAVAVRPRPDPDQALGRAWDVCRAALTPVAAGWEREVAERRAAAEEELARYYRRLLVEEVSGLRRVFRQVAVLQVRVSLAQRATTRRQFRTGLRRWETELDRQVAQTRGRAGQLAAELRRRRGEVARRYAARVEVRVLAIASLGQTRQPRLHRTE